MHSALLNRTSSFVQVPCGRCAVIHLNGRKASIPVSIGEISNLSLE